MKVYDTLKGKKMFRWMRIVLLTCIAGFVTHFAMSAYADEEAKPETNVAAPAEDAPKTAAAPAAAEPINKEVEVDSVAKLRSEVKSLWVCLAAFLVFFMQAGFTLVEAGFTRSKNACNIIMKNVMDFSIGSLAFWLIGFGLMFGLNKEGALSGWIGTSDFVFDPGTAGAVLTGHYGWAFLIFQTVFCATAATIVSGAVAERTKFVGYLAYSVLITIIVYPIFGHWAWGSLVGDGSAGWLGNMGFLDFAGSTVVHSIGGWAALAGAIVLGPRIGKFNKEGKAQPMPGHNLPLAALGVFILWLGWFGFNPGSTTAVDGGAFAFIAVTTNLSAAAGSIAAMITAWILFGKPDTSFALNGALAGLVAITAGCDVIQPIWAVITGAIGGVLVVFSVLFFDKLKIDDPVGAVSVHGVCGAWGTLAVGLFMSDGGLLMGGGMSQTIKQLTGIAVGFVWAFGVSFAIFYLIKVTIGLRVTEEEEFEGLDISEHGLTAYPNFQASHQ